MDSLIYATNMQPKQLSAHYTASNDFFSKIQAAILSMIDVYMIESQNAMRYVVISIGAVVATRFLRLSDSRLGNNMRTPWAKYIYIVLPDRIAYSRI